MTQITPPGCLLTQAQGLHLLSPQFSSGQSVDCGTICGFASESKRLCFSAEDGSVSLRVVVLHGAVYPGAVHQVTQEDQFMSMLFPPDSPSHSSTPAHRHGAASASHAAYRSVRRLRDSFRETEH